MRATRALLAHRWLAVVLVAFLHAAAAADAAELTVTAGGRTQKYTTAALLAHPAAATITVPADVAYKRPMTYRAVPVAALLGAIPREDSVKFVADDGFAATVGAARLLAAADDAARAYLAIEPQAPRWPALKAGSPATAGPFYVVWLRPEKGHIVPEQWPYQVARIEEVAPLAVRFPALLPAASVDPADPIRRGLAVFTTNCIVCHTFNLAGDAMVGPDLNVPYNPTEYMREEYLRRLIRNPASVRYWKDQKMPGFDAAAIGERELDELLAYFYYMAKRKVDAPAPR
jgi:mono/diheme cytochrome c family protein